MKSSTALGFVIFAAVPMGLMFWNFKGVKTAYLERSEGFESIERELEAIKLESARLEDVNNNLMHQISIEKENNASLIKEKEGLELRLENYRDSGSPDLGEREWTADELKARKKIEELVVKIRELPIKRKLKYRYSNWEVMASAFSKMPGMATMDEASFQSRAYAAMGFVNPGTDVRSRTLDLLKGQLGAAVYVGNDTIFLNEDSSIVNSYDGSALAIEIARALQDQHFELNTSLDDWLFNDDARLALWALAAGDTNLFKIRYQLQSNISSTGTSQAATRMSKQQFELIPSFIREYYLFPFSLGDRFCQTLYDKERWQSVNNAIARPPLSTSQIIHPELFGSNEDPKPERFRWNINTIQIDDVNPIWNNVAGELAIALLLNQSNFLERMTELGQPDIINMPELVSKGIEHFSERDGSIAAAGWLGDRYLVYPNGEGEGGKDHVFWMTKWTNKKDAKEFYDAILKSIQFRRSVKLNESDDEMIHSESGGRYISIKIIEDNMVRIIDAGDKKFADKIIEKFELSSP